MLNFTINCAKGVLQHNRHERALPVASRKVCLLKCCGHRAGVVDLPFTPSRTANKVRLRAQSEDCEDAWAERASRIARTRRRSD